ncbi:MAG TPA: HDOD domain-containing protein [Burkholderiaceae bacterium]|nr:HDOD domain-containing protein [Burkholderiaceae bacterium]
MPLPRREPLVEPLADFDAWVAHLQSLEIPVLAQTADALEALRANEDKVDANSIGEMIATDPLMTLKVLAYAAMHRARRVVTDTETVTSAIVLMGISPFFAAFGPQPTVEEWLIEQPPALAGLAESLRRAHRGANFALAFAVHRMDPDAAAIHAAALLHDCAEMLLWCHAPVLALRLQALYAAEPELRFRDAQRRVLNVELAPLQQSLMKAWRLPELLTRLTDDRHASHPEARCVALALRLARHSARGWDDPLIAHDVDEIAALLNLSPAAALHLVQAI